MLFCSFCVVLHPCEDLRIFCFLLSSHCSIHRFDLMSIPVTAGECCRDAEEAERTCTRPSIGPGASVVCVHSQSTEWNWPGTGPMSNRSVLGISRHWTLELCVFSFQTMMGSTVLISHTRTPNLRVRGTTRCLLESRGRARIHTTQF